MDDVQRLRADMARFREDLGSMTDLEAVLYINRLFKVHASIVGDDALEEEIEEEINALESLHPRRTGQQQAVARGKVRRDEDD